MELEQGHIMMYMRDSHFCYINCAESFDYGRTWSHKGSIDIPNLDSNISMEKINGKIILISNINKSFDYTGRTKLLIQISEDNCKT